MLSASTKVQPFAVTAKRIDSFLRLCLKVFGTAGAFPDFVNASPKLIIAGRQGNACLILHWEQRALFFALRAVRPYAAYRGGHKNISYISNIRLTPCFLHKLRQGWPPCL